MTAVRSPDAVYRKAFFKREFGSISHTDTHERMTHTHTIPKKKSHDTRKHSGTIYI